MRLANLDDHPVIVVDIDHGRDRVTIADLTTRRVPTACSPSAPPCAST
jgi:hypothetical protein